MDLNDFQGANSFSLNSFDGMPGMAGTTPVVPVPCTGTANGLGSRRRNMTITTQSQKNIIGTQGQGNTSTGGDNGNVNTEKKTYVKSNAPTSIVRRTMALRTTSAGGRVQNDAGIPKLTKELATKQKADNWETLRELNMQKDQIFSLEKVLKEICLQLGIDFVRLMDGIDASVAM